MYLAAANSWLIFGHISWSTWWTTGVTRAWLWMLSVGSPNFWFGYVTWGARRWISNGKVPNQTVSCKRPWKNSCIKENWHRALEIPWFGASLNIQAKYSPKFSMKNDGWKTTFLLGRPIFRVYVKHQGCMGLLLLIIFLSILDAIPFCQGFFKFYGMGTFNLAWSIGGGKDAYGHVGDTYGYQSQTTYVPEDDFVITVSWYGKRPTWKQTRFLGLPFREH